MRTIRHRPVILSLPLLLITGGGGGGGGAVLLLLRCLVRTTVIA